MTAVPQLGINNLTADALAAIPWRPAGSTLGVRPPESPTAPGPMSAIVVGPNGETSPNGTDELWCDALGRVKIRFHWQQAETPDDRDSCWVRVMSRQAGPGMGGDTIEVLAGPSQDEWDLIFDYDENMSVG